MGKHKNKQKIESGELHRPAKASLIKQINGSFPLSFPAGLKYPKSSFLRNEPPCQQSFQQALETCYEGFVVDDAKQLKDQHGPVENALQVMEAAGFFRVDVTQPFGLGTKCARTYVTRCLVGEPGTTYKYLGLRMFAHPWNQSGKDEVKNALATVGKLNATLTERTEHHLAELDKKRRSRGGEAIRGRAGFDIALINRMESVDGLKDEPSMGEGKCSVSWHADSSLEHYSTIAVYQLLSKECNDEGKWTVGLRVAHNSEGPRASHRGTDIAIDSESPPIAVSLPSRSTYYMLEDFNHHHQHTVVAEGKVPGRRFSSTHRLLRESHNVAHILARCKTTCTGFHRKGPKVWRSEQLLLTEMESEWLRQFFIQGQAHCDILWHSWKEPVHELLKYWTQLEERTKQTIDWLQFGAEGQCGWDEASTDGPPPPRSERKLKEKRKKAREGMHELLSRGESKGGALADIYEPIAVLLEERATMRELWSQREKDGVFHELSRDNRPMPLPFDFMVSGSDSKPAGRGSSPLPGTADELRSLVNQLRRWGEAFESGMEEDLPTVAVASAPQWPSGNHSKPMKWAGWSSLAFGLEMQQPWAGLLLQGKKSIETRAYDLPRALIGKKIEILQSRMGKAGISGLKDSFILENSDVERVGWCKFEKVIEYHDKESFVSDEGKHMVKSDSGYGWKDGATEVIFGWVVGDSGFYKSPDLQYAAATRRLRSLFELIPATRSTKTNKRKEIESKQEGPRNRKKRRKHRTRAG